ncbi:hypothetical protein J7K86_02145 [bacterium]|nr:hypothetical protein [bacterium]
MIWVLMSFMITSAKYDPWFGSDKLFHFVGWTTISFLSHGVYQGFYQSTDNRGLYLAITNGATSGLFYELQDGFFPRGADGASPRDFIWDIAGSLTGTFLAKTITKNKGFTNLHKFWKRKKKSCLFNFGLSVAMGFIGYGSGRIEFDYHSFTNEQLMARYTIIVTSSFLSISINEHLFLPREDRTSWKMLLIDAAGSFTGTFIASKIFNYNPRWSQLIFKLFHYEFN